MQQNWRCGCGQYAEVRSEEACCAPQEPPACIACGAPMYLDEHRGSRRVGPVCDEDAYDPDVEPYIWNR